jgi:nicotinate-nucleotide pyrophosphorylase (carboxylating)
MADRRSAIPPAPPPAHEVRSIVRRALEEDLPWGDVTTDALVAADIQAVGSFVLREEGTICGLEVAAAVFSELDPSLRFLACVADGDQLPAGSTVAEIRGAARPILMGERTALNLLQRMSGVATATAAYVQAVAGTGAVIVDTRKTAPGLRALDKYAVRCGGGTNHRQSLSDGVLVKDNHIVALDDAAGDLESALRAARRAVPHTMRLEVEVDRLDQIELALAGGADIVLLDNMNPATLRRAVDLIAGRALTEASGGVTLEKVRDIALAGVNLISVGALTHSVRALDLGLDVSLQRPAIE